MRASGSPLPASASHIDERGTIDRSSGLECNGLTTIVVSSRCSQDCNAMSCWALWALWASEQSISALARRRYAEEFQAYLRGVPLGRKCRSGEKRRLWVGRFLREAESPRVAMPRTHRLGGVWESSC